MSTDFDNLVITNNGREHRFETVVDEHLAVVEYRRSGDHIIFTHTEVPDALAGHGIGHKLARASLEHARTEQLQVVAQCRFIATYIQEHPAYQPLVAPESRDPVAGG